MTSDLLQYLWNGVSAGSTYALLGVSITLVFGLARIINFAVGQFLMVGAFIGYSVVDATGSYLLALPAAIGAVALIGLVADRVAFRFTYDHALAGFIVSLGITLLIQAVIIEVWTAETKTLVAPIAGRFDVLGIVLRRQAVMNTLLSAMAIAGLFLLLRGSRFGHALRAVSDDRGAAELMGVPVRRVIMGTAVLAGAIVGLNGWIVMTTSSINSELGHTYMLRGFAVALVGGLGSINGAVATAFGLAIVENLAVGYGDPAWSDVYLFGLVIALLIWKPSGLGQGVAGAEL